MSEQRYDLEHWAPLYSSPESERATTAAMLPASERQAYLDSLPPVTQEERDRPWYAHKTAEELEAGGEAGDDRLESIHT